MGKTPITKTFIEKCWKSWYSITINRFIESWFVKYKLTYQTNLTDNSISFELDEYEFSFFAKSFVLFE